MEVNRFLAICPKQHRTWFTAAIAVAMASKGVGGRHKNTFRLGSVLSDGKRLWIAKHNSYKTHPLLLRFTAFPYLHAESAAIFALGLDNCNDLTIYTVRLMRNNHIAPASPCKTCLAVMKAAGLERALYSTYEGYEMAFL